MAFVVVGQAPQTLRHEPKEGWNVKAFHYYTAHHGDEGFGQPACVFLAEDAEGQQQGVQWWMYGDPTAFHGDWQQGASTLCLHFNARGPLYDDGSARTLKGTYLQCRPISEEHPTNYYEGYDQSNRRVKMVPYGAWTLRKEGEYLVWEDV